MPVVIDDFEVLPDEPRPAEAEPGVAERRSDAAEKVEPEQMLALLQRLEARALRTWAH